MAKTLSRFYILKKDENKEKATLFVRVQAPNRKIDVQFTTRIQVVAVGHHLLQQHLPKWCLSGLWRTER